MLKEINGYPYNSRVEDEHRIFFSDKLCEKIIKISCKNGKIFCALKNKIKSKKKQISLSTAIFFCALLVMTGEAKSIGVPVRASHTPQIIRPAEQYVYKHAPTIDTRIDKIFMIANSSNTRLLPLIYINGHYSYINEQLLKKLRSGDLTANISVVAIGLLVCVMFQLAGVTNINAFKIISAWNALHPPRTPAVSPSSTQIALIPTKAQQFNDMLLKFNEPKENTCIVRENGFIMSAEEAEKLISKTYPGYLEVIEDFKISDRQAAKHIYHANGMGIKPQDYGFTQQELELIRGEDRYQEGGLGAYVRRGYRLPPIEMIQDYQLRLKESCEKALIRRTNVPYYDVNGVWPSRVFAIPPTEDSAPIIVAFNESTKDLITGDKQQEKRFSQFKDNNFLGSKRYMLKWRNK